MTPLARFDVVTGILQGRRNGFEHGGDSEIPVTFKSFIVQTSNLQF